MKTILYFKLLLILFVGATSYSAPQCLEIFKGDQVSRPETSMELTKFKNGQELAQWLVENNVPHFMKETPQGEKPVILASRETIDKVSEVIQATFAVQVLIRPGGRSDHGLIRLADTQIDRSTPGGIRDFGEINNNGFSWRSMTARVNRRTEDSFTIMEALFSLSKKEQEAILFYQMIRRGSFFETEFSFGTVPEMKIPTAIKQGSEHCFTFCKGTALNSQISGLKEAASAKIDSANVEKVMESKEFSTFITSLREEFKKIDPNNAQQLIYTMLPGVKGYSTVEALLGKKLSKEEANVVIAWMVSIKATEAYAKALEKIELDSGLGIEDIHRPRSIGAIVYSQDPVIGKSVKDGSFQASGVSYSWKNNGQRKVSLQQTSPKRKTSKAKSQDDKAEIDSTTFGDKANPAVVLVHGLGGSQRTWREVAEELSQDYFVVTYDQRGHGKSRYKGNAFDSKEMAADMNRVLEKHSIKQAHVVGHSMGGRTVMSFAELFPEKTLSVTVEDMHMKGRSKKPYEVDPGTLKFYEQLPDKMSLDELSSFFSNRQKNSQTRNEISNEIRRWVEIGVIREIEPGIYETSTLREHLIAVHNYRVQALNEDLTAALGAAPNRTLFLAADPNKQAVLFGVGIEHIQKTRDDLQIVTFKGANHGIHHSRFQAYISALREHWAE